MLGEKQPFENFIKPFNNESSDAQIAGGVEKTEGSAFGLLTAKKEDDKTYLEWLIEKSYHQTLSALIYKGAFVDGDNEINLNEGFAQSPLLRASKIFASDPTNADAKAMLQILLYGGIETVLGSARYNVYKKAERAAGAVTSVIAAADGFTSGALTSAAEAVSNSAGTAWEWAKEMVSQLKQLEDVETDASQIGEAGTASEVQDALISKPSDRIFKEENRAFVVLADGSLEIVTNILKAGDADLVAKVLLWYGKPYNQAQFKDGQKDLAEAALVEAIAANKDADAVIKFVTDYAAQAKKSEVDVLKLVCIKEIDDKVKDKVIGYFYHKNIGDKKSHSLKSVIDVIAAQERNEKVTSFKAVKTTIAKEIEAAFSPNRKRVVAEGAMVEGLQQSMIGGQAIEDLSNSTIDRAGYKLVLRDVDLQKKWDTHTEKYSVSTIARVADNEKRTMLHAAVSLGEVELVETLVKNFADINAVDKAGQTPMQYAINLVTSAANDKKSEAYKDAVAIAKLLILGRGADTMNILTSGVLFYGAQYRSPIDTARFSKNKREGYVDATALNELLSVLEPQDLALILQYLAANQPHILFSGALKNGFSEAVEGQTEIGLVIRRNATLAASNLEVQMTGLADELRAKLELGNLPNSVKELEKLEKEIKDLYAEKYDILADVVSNDGPNRKYPNFVLPLLAESLSKQFYDNKIGEISQKKAQILQNDTGGGALLPEDRATGKRKGKKKDGAGSQNDNSNPQLKQVSNAHPQTNNQALENLPVDPDNQAPNNSDVQPQNPTPQPQQDDQPVETRAAKERIENKKIGIRAVGAFTVVTSVALDAALKTAASHLISNETALKVINFAKSKIGPDLADQVMKYLPSADLARLALVASTIALCAYSYSKNHNARQDSDASISKRSTLNTITFLAGTALVVGWYTGYVEPTIVLEKSAALLQYMSHNVDAMVVVGSPL